MLFGDVRKSCFEVDIQCGHRLRTQIFDLEDKGREIENSIVEQRNNVFGLNRQNHAIHDFADQFFRLCVAEIQTADPLAFCLDPIQQVIEMDRAA